MPDSVIFTFGIFAFVMLTGGLILTLREFRRMGNRDQVDSYPRSTTKGAKTTGSHLC